MCYCVIVLLRYCVNGELVQEPEARVEGPCAWLPRSIFDVC